MKLLYTIIRYPKGSGEGLRPWHHLWLSVTLTGLGLCVGLLSLLLAAGSYDKLPGLALFRSYFSVPGLALLNLWVPVLLIWLFYFLFGRCWCAYLGSFLPIIGLSLANYYKIQLRSDPVLAADLGLVTEAGDIVSNYTLELTPIIRLTAACFVAGLLFALLFQPRGLRRWGTRLFGLCSCAALLAVSFAALYTNQDLYRRTANEELINPWSDVEVFVSRGCVYPFLYSARDMFPAPPPGYDRGQAALLLGQYPDRDIPPERQVNVVGIMLEAFCDLTDFPALASQTRAARIYDPWHALEEQSVSGDLLTNIFAGGTVDSEWSFLTGYTRHDPFRRNTDSYVWYLDRQGYQTRGGHPGYGWFYNRQNVNRYLGFQEYWFTENHYGALVDPVDAVWNSDQILREEIVRDLGEILDRGEGPCFSFSVSYQNHGPYEGGHTAGEAYLTPTATGWSGETCNILNNYLKGIQSTIAAMTGLAADLEELEEPVVLVLFGDHKPWAGNGNSVYTQLGASFDLSTLEGFYQYYSTPYLIWANSAAQRLLGGQWTGDGGDFSPCFLMNRVFDLCGWEGPGFMQLSNQVRALTPLVHVRDLYLSDGRLTDTLPGEDGEFLGQFLCAQYYREHEVEPLN